MAEFVTVGSASEIRDGEMKVFTVNGYGVAVANVGGTFRAFQDECTHQTCSLAEGDIEGNTVVCLCHNGEFDVTTGAVVGGPPPGPLPVYEVRVQGDDLQVAL